MAELVLPALPVLKEEQSEQNRNWGGKQPPTRPPRVMQAPDCYAGQWYEDCQVNELHRPKEDCGYDPVDANRHEHHHNGNCENRTEGQPESEEPPELRPRGSSSPVRPHREAGLDGVQRSHRLCRPVDVLVVHAFHGYSSSIPHASLMFEAAVTPSFRSSIRSALLARFGS